ncbi:HNH endonuclease signature motif containing protein [Shouchella lehensis]|uniref:HNH endonuclease n=1 Tax=Shouchella lehensis TaxID=300825 RepID=A0A4Y7WI72_9BACI|nr:HNH endonuclease signature motif containing protein [Shouchella lehensis]TES48059.1 HNH endonuclease [Shouchella lehensis]
MPITVKCKCCFKQYSVPPSRVNVNGMNFCSKPCQHQYRRSNHLRSFPIDYEIDENGCFICTSHKKGKRGYPRMHEKLVFRHVYEQMIGPLEKGELVRHLCDNKMCINPEHLRKGTQLENVRDALRNKRIKVGEEHHSAKISEIKVYALKVLLEKTDLTHKELNLITGVPDSTIKSIKYGKAWRSVKV